MNILKWIYGYLAYFPVPSSVPLRRKQDGWPNDMDVGNMQMLRAGAKFSSWKENIPHDWKSIDSAPRDGTVIEIANLNGVIVSFGLYKSAQGHLYWQDADDPNSGFARDFGRNLVWRPYNGSIQDYIDPTNGAQYSPAYERGAMCKKYGLPLNHLEKETAQNVRLHAR